MPRRVDANHGAVRDGLRACGYISQDLSQVGDGCPDLLVGAPWGQLFLLEVKSEKGKLTPDQEVWHVAWRHQRPLVVRSVADAVKQMTALRNAPMR